MLKLVKYYTFIAGVCFTAVSFSSMALAAPPAKEKEVEWGYMPAGARSTYIGIHGGTIPVSLLTAGDGSPMIAQVGLTGSDFLNFLRSSGKPFVSQEPEINNNLFDKNQNFPIPTADVTILKTGNETEDVPVLYATGNSFEQLSLVPENWAPFGLTEQPLAIEGQIAKPKKVNSKKK